MCGLCCTFFMYNVVNVPTKCMHTLDDINTAIANEHFKVKCNKTSIDYTCMCKIVSFLCQRERSVTTYIQCTHYFNCNGQLPYLKVPSMCTLYHVFKGTALWLKFLVFVL